MRKLLILATAIAATSGGVLAQPFASDPAAPGSNVPYASAFESPNEPENAKPKTGLTPPLLPLLPQQALQLALQKQPALFLTPQMAAQEKAEVVAAVGQLRHRLDRAWISAVAAQQALGTVRAGHEAAQTAASLAQRMVKVGNWSKVPLLQAQLLESASATQVAQAQLEAMSSSEDLVKLMGLWGQQAHDLPAQLPQLLPQLPPAPLAWAGLEAQALQNHLALATAAFNARSAQAQVRPQDVQALQNTLASTARSLGASSASALQAAAISAPELPAQLARPRHALMEALTEQAHADTLAANIRSQAREAWFRYRSAWDAARHQRDVVLPLSTALQEETQLRYNGMLQSTWELLASARARLDSVQTVTQSQRDFWLAHTDFQAVLAGVTVNFAPPSGPNSSGANAAQGH